MWMGKMSEQFYENTNVIDSIEKDGIKIEILEYKSLKGSKDQGLAENLFYVQNAGMSLKQVKISLDNGGLLTEAGTLHFHKGNITAESKTGGVGGFAKKLVKNKLTNESIFKPHYKGTGEIFLEPSFGHFIIVELNNDSVVVDKGLFYCCEETLKIGVENQKNLSSGLFGSEGWFQTKITGSGLCVLEIPVPLCEVIKYEMENEKLQVDGNFAFLRSASINYSVQKSTKNLVGALTSGEGMLQTFEGTGKVWIAPTQSVYGNLIGNGFGALATSTRNRTNDS